MDGSRFDALTRTLGGQRSRRGVLGALTGAALGAIGIGRSGEAAAAGCRAVGNSCTSNSNCCSGNCVTESRNRKKCHCSAAGDCALAPNACFTAGGCQGGACFKPTYNGDGTGCPGGVCSNQACCAPVANATTCAGKCGSQTNNCGQSVDCGPCCTAAGQACGSDGACCSGVCVGGVCAGGKGSAGAACDSGGDCASGLTCCGGMCIDTSTSNANCGGCGAVCTIPNGTGACAGGQCTVASCNSGFQNCKGGAGDGCETNTTNDPDNCGGCGQICDVVNGTAGCNGGSCTIASCEAGYADCDGLVGTGCDVHIDVDPLNCGACGHACSVPDHGAATCAGGSCGISCGSGYLVCAGVCKRGPIQTCSSDGECCSGACDQGYCLAAPLGTGAICDSAADCASGVCCRTICTDPASYSTDPINCGACGQVCVTQACFNSGCVACNPGATRACYDGDPNTRKIGVCKDGQQTCAPDGSGWSACMGQTLPSAEACDGFDNDCDGVVDNGNPGGGLDCNTGKLGVCAAGTTACQGGAIVCVQHVQPSAEVCDGLDNDCNGVVDNGNPGGGQACNTGLQGVCAPGTTACQGGALVCNQNVLPRAETCNGLDDDCNGQIDNGAAASCTPKINMTAACTGGACAYTCNAGYANCDANPANGCEINLTNDVNNCGSCGHVCSSTNGTPSCQYGQCQITCAPGYDNCDGNVNTGCETDLTTADNCGYCYRGCSGGNAGNISCQGGNTCCGDTNAGSVCCSSGRPTAYFDSYCDPYPCYCYDHCYSCGAFGKRTCCDYYCDSTCYNGCYYQACN